MKKAFGKRGFTLLELIVVIIIIGILAVLGFTQYVGIIEKGRSAEAKSNLGTLRTLLIAYNQEYGNMTGFTDAYIASSTYLPTATCNNTFFFRYTSDNAGTLTATRCTSNGKDPQGATAYTMTLSMNGTVGGQW